MTAASIAVHHGGIRRAFDDIATITWRNLINIKRSPQLLVFSTIQPVMFVLMFRYVFGGAIQVPGVPYVDYLMPGIFAQTVVFGAIGTGIGLAEDLSKGLVERFRSLPMARSAVLVGRSASDLIRNVFVVILMVAVGFAVGFRIHTDLLHLVLAVGLLLAFGFALSWLFAIIGLATRSAETTQAAAFPLMAPLVFASSAFVPVGSMPGWLQPFARDQPVSVTIAAMRKLLLGGAVSPQQYEVLGTSGSTWHLVLISLAWSVGIVAVFAPLAVARYRRST
jgi:ABC-2 type transport system permease protein/oleandomycin transport system permease protein